MTSEDRLAAIEALPVGTYRDTNGDVTYGVVLSPTNFASLIAEVRRLQEVVADYKRQEDRNYLVREGR